MKIISHNCNQQQIPGKIAGIIGGSEKIGLFQEVPNCLGLKDSAYTEDVVNTYGSFKLLKNGTTVGFWSPNVGMTSPSKGAKRIPKAENHGTFVCWSSEYEYMNFMVPGYMGGSLSHGGSEIGIRTSYWIVLQHVVTGNLFSIMSVHGNNNAAKRQILLEYLFDEAKAMENVGYNIVIGGDFNEKPIELLDYLETNLVTPCDTSKITHVNYDVTPVFRGRLDYVFMSKTLGKFVEKVEGLDRTAQSMSKKMTAAKRDHANLIIEQVP